MELPSLSVPNWSSLWCETHWAFAGAVPSVSLDSPYVESGYRAWLMIKGEGHLKFQGQTYVAKPGNWLFIPSGEGTQHFTQGAQIISISFRAQWPSGEALLEASTPRHLDVAQLPDLKERALAFARACHLHPLLPHFTLNKDNLPLGGLCQINACLFHWLELFIEAAAQAGWQVKVPSDVDPRYADAQRLVSNHPLAHPFRTADLADKVGLSISQLNRIFALHAGQTPASLLEQRRREYAQSRVEQSSMPFKEIAYAIGFSAPGHFTTWYRKTFGTTPSRGRSRSQDSRNAPSSS
ncbi:AraC family transcriptional regulator [Kiritimatiellota bacterium B12222]|nr:AraC family transcriptional regulator [Kiritimatiellota bacterium B12222]